MTETYKTPKHGWTCFHCGETFTTIGAAADHFGYTPESIPGCLLKSRVNKGNELGFLMLLRKAESALDYMISANLGDDSAMQENAHRKCCETLEAIRGDISCNS